MYEYLLIGIVGLAVHFAIVGLVYGIAKAQHRDAPLFWAGAAMITGPIALVLLYVWRNDRGGPEQAPTPGGPHDTVPRDSGHAGPL